MSDFTELVFGFILWLASCLFILNLYSNSNKHKFQPEFNVKKSHPPVKKAQISEEKIVLEESNQEIEKMAVLELEIKAKKSEELEQKLIQKQEELEVAKERIYLLLEELELTSSQLKSWQDQSFELETKFKQEKANFENQIIDLQKQCKQLKTNLNNNSRQLKTDFQEETFEQLHCLLTNYPTAKLMTIVKPDLPAKNLVALFKPLDNLLAHWRFQPIGKPWEQVAYNPQLHQPDYEDLKIGELVFIRFIGYRRGDRILYPAKVSRTLPGKNKK